MGPLKGVKIVEMAGIGPGPFCAMLLSDMGADVIRVDRPGGNNLLGVNYEAMNRGRRSIVADLKTDGGKELVLKLIEKADGLIEGNRPGVMERLGLGPDICHDRNKRLIYGRMTGWGQEGPLAQAAGHDLNYIALTGILSAIGTSKSGPVVPLNLIGDFGGGGMYLAFGMVCAILEARQSGQGQVIDSAMTDGAAHLATMFYNLVQQQFWTEKREQNVLDGGAHFYGTYQCADDEWISIGSIEPQFYALLLEKCGINDPEFKNQHKKENWPQLSKKLEVIFLQKSRDEWCALMEGSDVCFAPVLSWQEAFEHPHNKLRETFIERDGIMQPAPAPRFSRTKAEVSYSPPKPDEHRDEILSDWNIANS